MTIDDRQSGREAPTIPSGSRAIDEGTPVYSTVEDAHDQSRRSEGTHKLPENLDAAQQEIAALRATIQELQQLVISGKMGNRKSRPTRNTKRSHQSPRSSHSDTRSGNKKFPHRRSRPPPSGDEDPSISGDSNRSDYSGRRHRSHRSHKVEDPDKLNDGVNPTYYQWRDLLDGKMYQNRDWWKTEYERMFYVFRMTEGKARDYLHTRWGPNSYDPFVDVADMLEFLRQNFTNPNEVREAKDAYAELKQGSTPFPEFRAQFLLLAMQGHIPRSEFKDDLFRKLNPRVRELLSGCARDLTYAQLCERALDVDNEVRINQKLVAAKRAAKTLPMTGQTTAGQRTYTPSPGILPIRQSLPPVPDRTKRSATMPPDRQRSHTAEEVHSCHNCGKPGHWAKECPDSPRPRINGINELYPRVMEVDTDDEESGAESQPENGDA
jgi:Zinc knuckle